ncbi:Membrane protein involved in the export of O-antigen, teichoic acid lipoteichoic acids [hydrothermal vent metagenome]|uniref:Membrane protein involved in the export of O-antigen, teichoic acid lipoteichoic acids n=1 Tax=hydrothermal vent metagenome TaxID=652676 RepID=A0A1W1BSP8_9ZZZZ
MLNRLYSLKSHKGFLRYFKNTTWLFGERVLRMIVGLFIGVWVARYLGAEQFGLLSYAQSFVGLFSAVATLGLDSIIVRELVKDISHQDRLIGTAFGLKLMGAFGVLGLLIVAISFTSNDSYTNSLIFIIASATIFQSFNVIDLYFQSQVMSRYIVYANFISLTTSTIVKVYLLLHNAPLIYFAWVVLLDNIVLMCGFIYFYIHNSHTLKKWKFDTTLAKRLLKDSLPLVGSGIVVAIYMKIDQVMIKEMLDSGAVGNYAVAVRLSEVWYFIPMVISSSLFPAIINAKKVDEKLYYDRLQRLFNLMVWLSIAIAIPASLLSDWVIELLYTDLYSGASSVLKVYIWSCLFVFLGVASGKWYISENLQILAFWRTFYGMVANVVLNLILIPKYGILGAAIATLVSQIIATYLFDIFDKRTREIFYMKSRSIFWIGR